MLVGSADELFQLKFSQEQGSSLNSSGGFYQRGKSYGMETKLFVAATYLDCQERCNGKHLSIRKIASHCRVGKDFVIKIICELEKNAGQVVAPDIIYSNRNVPVGPGSIRLTSEDRFVLYCLYQKDPTRSLRSYVYWLFSYTGTIISESTIS